jgi:hypothetical protein
MHNPPGFDSSQAGGLPWKTSCLISGGRGTEQHVTEQSANPVPEEKFLWKPVVACVISRHQYVLMDTVGRRV